MRKMGTEGLGLSEGTRLESGGTDSNSGVPLNRVPSCLPEMEIYGLLKAQGPHKALHIAQALGLKTAKEVNRDLYAMRNMHLLTLDQKSNAWGVYQPGRPLPAAHTWTGQRGRAATRNRKTQHLALAGLLPTSPLPAPPRHPPPRAACCGPGDRSLRRGFQEGRACWRRNQGRGLPGGVAPS